MNAFPILYPGLAPESQLESALSGLRTMSAALTAADNRLLALEFNDLIDTLTDVIDKIEPVLKFLNDIDFPGCTEKFAQSRRDWIVAKGGAA